jgi:putative endopeptidase
MNELLKEFSVFFSMQIIVSGLLLSSSIVLAENSAPTPTSLPQTTSQNTSPPQSTPAPVKIAQSNTPQIIPDRRDFTLDTKTSPCEDFHQYVCGAVESKFELRADRSKHYFAFDDSNERLLEYKKKFMLNIDNEKKLAPRAQQVQDYYLSCMNESARKIEEKNLTATIIKLVAPIKTEKDLIHFSHQQLWKGNYSFTPFFSKPNSDDPLKLDGGVITNLMFLPDNKYYDNNELLKNYEELITSFFIELKLEKDPKKAADRAKKIIALEKEAAKTFPTAAVRRQRWTENRQMSQAAFLKKYPTLEYEEIFQKFPKETAIFIPYPEGIDTLQENLKNKQIDTLKDIYLYQSLAGKMDQAYPSFFEKSFQFNKKWFGGPDVRPILQERCTKSAMGMFGKELDEVLTERVFPNFQSEKITEVGEKIRQSIISGIEKNSWLSSEGKQEALNKIKKVRLQLVKPQTDAEWDFFPTKKYNSKTFIANQYLRAKVSDEKTLDELTKPANRDAWGMAPLTVNAYYSSEENKFVLPIGILQYPFFDAKLSTEENLGAGGAVIGHEIGHGIDDVGSKFDSDGKLHQWMSLNDLGELSKRGSQLIEQFNKIGHDGRLTLGENVADLVGLTFAYNAAFPGNAGTPEQKQKFFVAYARVWCGVIRPTFNDLLRKTDPHSAGWARINEQVKHQEGFQEAFQCKPNDKMHLPSAHQVKIW